MFRNQYDTDVTTFSPAGRLHQVEYATEGVKQGSCCVGVRSKDYVVLAALKRQADTLASYNEKIFDIDAHMGIVVSGLIADARVLTKYMQTECLNHKWVFETPMLTNRLVQQVADKCQTYTQNSDKRPYGVGLLVAGYDKKTGPHLFQILPSGNFFEYHAIAMGARAQTAKTYLEKHFESFGDLSVDDLIKHALVALKGSSPTPLTSQNTSLCVVGRDKALTLYMNDNVRFYVSTVEKEPKPEEQKDEQEEEKEDLEMTAGSTQTS